jgi:hypothetical protein
LPIEAGIVVRVHAALENSNVAKAIKKPRGNTQRTDLIASCPRGTDLIALANHVVGRDMTCALTKPDEKFEGQIWPPIVRAEGWLQFSRRNLQFRVKPRHRPEMMPIVAGVIHPCSVAVLPEPANRPSPWKSISPNQGCAVQQNLDHVLFEN